MDKRGRRKRERERVRVHFWRFSAFDYWGGGLNQEPCFFPLIKPFLYTCFSGWAVLVVFESPRAGAFDRVTGRQRDGTGRERAGGRIF